MTLVVKAAGGTDPASLTAPVRALVRAADSNLPVSEVRTVQDVLDAAVAEERFMMTLLSIFGGKSDEDVVPGGFHDRSPYYINSYNTRNGAGKINRRATS